MYIFASKLRVRYTINDIPSSIVDNLAKVIQSIEFIDQHNPFDAQTWYNIRNQKRVLSNMYLILSQTNWRVNRITCTPTKQQLNICLKNTSGIGCAIVTVFKQSVEVDQVTLDHITW